MVDDPGSVSGEKLRQDGEVEERSEEIRSSLNTRCCPQAKLNIILEILNTSQTIQAMWENQQN